MTSSTYSPSEGLCYQTLGEMRIPLFSSQPPVVLSDSTASRTLKCAALKDCDPLNVFAR